MGMCIKQCPVCGAVAQIMPDPAFWFVECRRCGMAGPRDGFDEDEAIAKWNAIASMHENVSRLSRLSWALARCANAALDDREDDLRALIEAAEALSWDTVPLPDQVDAEAQRHGYEPWPQMDNLRLLLADLGRKYRV